MWRRNDEGNSHGTNSTKTRLAKEELRSWIAWWKQRVPAAKEENNVDEDDNAGTGVDGSLAGWLVGTGIYL